MFGTTLVPHSRVVLMSKRNNVKKTYLSDAEAKKLSRWASEVDKSESALLREAVLEYLDKDRTARLESKVDEIQDTLGDLQAQVSDDDAHTHKDDTPMSTASSAVEDMRSMIRRIQSNHDDVLNNDAVERAIEDIAGFDDRTIAKYKKMFRKRGLLFEHPGEPPLWTTDADTWLDWMSSYIQLNGREEAEAVADQYPARITLGSDDTLYVELSEEVET